MVCLRDVKNFYSVLMTLVMLFEDLDVTQQLIADDIKLYRCHWVDTAPIFALLIIDKIIGMERGNFKSQLINV